jgi:hypothetical protein
MWGPFHVMESDLSKLRGIQLGTLMAHGALENYQELNADEIDALYGFDRALYTLHEPRHAEGTCINLQGRDDTPFIEYVAPDQDDRTELVEQYETAAEVAGQIADAPADHRDQAVDDAAYQEAMDAAIYCSDFLQERYDELHDDLLV